MENKHNFKKLLCYNIVNNCKCVYKNKCMFAHTLEEQKKEPIRQYIHNMIYIWDDLSNININDDKNLLDELTILTKECKNCINKKCPGGYNCRFGTCLRENKICYNDMMYGKCYNMIMETNHDDIILYRCIHGIHLTEKKLIPYNQRMLSELTNLETNFLIKHNVNFNSKNNIISIGLNDNTIGLIKDIISNKITKTEIINNLRSNNNIFKNTLKDDDDDDNIFDDLFDEKNHIFAENNENYEEFYKKMNFENEKIIDKIIIYDDYCESNNKINIDENNTTYIDGNNMYNIDNSNSDAKKMIELNEIYNLEKNKIENYNIIGNKKNIEKINDYNEFNESKIIIENIL